ncbi:unnamed protein product, partial [Closterium sp. NIES-54]
MAISNFVLTVVGIGAAVLLLKGDVKRTATTLRRNVRQMRVWLEEEEAAVKKSLNDTPKQIERESKEMLNPLVLATTRYRVFFLARFYFNGEWAKVLCLR